MYQDSKSIQIRTKTDLANFQTKIKITNKIIGYNTTISYLILQTIFEIIFGRYCLKFDLSVLLFVFNPFNLDFASYSNLLIPTVNTL